MLALEGFEFPARGVDGGGIGSLAGVRGGLAGPLQRIDVFALEPDLLFEVGLFLRPLFGVGLGEIALKCGGFQFERAYRCLVGALRLLDLGLGDLLFELGNILERLGALAFGLK